MNLSKAFNQLTERRYSPRQFSDRPITQEVLLEIISAVRQAPSSFNEQPWRFIYALKSGESGYEDLLSCLNEKNQTWAVQAPALMLGIAKTTFSSSDKPNRHAWYDTGAAVGMMTLKATALDVFVHQMAGFDASRAQKVLQIPDGYEPVAMIAMGYLDDEQKPEKPRRSLEEIAFAGRWKSGA